MEKSSVKVLRFEIGNLSLHSNHITTKSNTMKKITTLSVITFIAAMVFVGVAILKTDFSETAKSLMLFGCVMASCAALVVREKLAS